MRVPNGVCTARRPAPTTTQASWCFYSASRNGSHGREGAMPEPVLRLFDPTEPNKGKRPRKPREGKITLWGVRADGERMGRIPMIEKPKPQQRSGRVVSPVAPRRDVS